MRNSPAKGAFSLKNAGSARKVTVLGENRTIDLKGGRFDDDFKPYAVHLYRIEAGR
jgi:hypothetical protein